MQIGTVSRLWLRGRSWRFEIHLWRKILRFWKSFVCSNKLDVQETNCCFAQFNGSWNHLFGHWTEKKQLADILTKGNFTHDEWNHLLNMLNISQFSSRDCTAAMPKRPQQGSGEERVTAKSRPMMNLTARMPSVVSSSTSSNPGRTCHGYQDPGKSVAVDDRSRKLDRQSPAGYSKEDYGRAWSSQEWKSGAAAHDRSGKPDETSWNAMQQVRPHHEEPLLDGNAQSVRNGETIHDGPGQLDSVNY